MKMKVVGCLIVLLLNGWVAFGQKQLTVVPMPAEVKMGKNFFTIDDHTVIASEHIPALQQYSIKLKEYLKNNYYLSLRAADISGIKESKSIVLQFARPADSLPKDGYKIVVDKDFILLLVSNENSIFLLHQTLIQLLPEKGKPSNQKHYPLSIPQLSIKDYPRFAYRGMHLDASRHFMPVDLVKRYIDYLAMYKFNTFHWHLTDDQGWRIEIKKYPKLTETGAWRNGTIIGAYPGTGNDSIRYGGFYTQEQIKEVVQYAADRYISVIPEIELPGHSSAAIAAYPELSCFPNEDTKYPAESVWAGPTKGKQVQQTWGVFEDVFCPTEYTFNFLQGVLDEVMELFPSKYIHIGGDECPKENWRRSSFCQQLMKERGLKDARLNDSFGQEYKLQSYFIQRIEKYINSKGKKIIGWDEILEGGLAPNATVMSWRGEAGGIAAAKQQHDVIMTPGEPLYLNHSQSKNEDSVTQGGYNPIEDVYNYEPIPKELTAEEGRYILGAQGNVWSEYIDNPWKLEYLIFPRMAALAEVLWTPGEKRNWKDFERRLPVIMERLDKEKINYSKAYYEFHATVLPMKDFSGVEWKIKSALKGIKQIKIVYPLKYDQERIIRQYDSFGNMVKEEKITVDHIQDYSQNNADTLSCYIKTSGTASAFLHKGTAEFGFEIVYNELHPLSHIKQYFHFNKATGKKITLSSPATSQYPGDGPFTLVNGVQNTKGISKAREFLGFNGTDCEAIIDLGKADSISKVTVHALNDNGAWVWKPSAVEIYIGEDENNLKPMGSSTDFIKTTGANGFVTVKFEKSNARFVKVLVKNWGTIPAGYSGSSSNAWLFVDEIEAE